MSDTRSISSDAMPLHRYDSESRRKSGDSSQDVMPERRSVDSSLSLGSALSSSVQESTCWKLPRARRFLRPTWRTRMNEGRFKACENSIAVYIEISSEAMKQLGFPGGHVHAHELHSNQGGTSHDAGVHVGS